MVNSLYYTDIYLNTLVEVKRDSWKELISNYRIYRKKGVIVYQKWEVISADKYRVMMRTINKGIVNEITLKNLNHWGEILLFNYLKLEFNNVIVGHESTHSKDYLMELFDELPNFNPKGITNLYDTAIVECIEDDAFTDYGLPRLWVHLEEFFSSDDPKIKLEAVTDFLSVTHCRGDLCRFFIEEGTKHLRKLTYNDTITYTREYKLSY